MACPFTPSPHGLCFSPSWVWSYTETNSQVPTISSLSDFCCWARVGKAELIANPTRASSKRIFISSFWGLGDLLPIDSADRKGPCWSVSPSFFHHSADWNPEKAVLHAIGIKIKSHNFPLRIDRIDLGLLGSAARAGHVNGREDAIVPDKAVQGA